MTDNIPINIDCGIEYEVINFGGHQHINNYRDKFLWALAQDSEYFFKLDEDIIFSNHVWDYIIENRQITKDPNVITLSPTINIGVPTVDLFIESFCPELKNEIENMFLQVDIQKTAGQRWGMDLEHLNDFTIRANKWDSVTFHKRLTEMHGQIKGIHPVRFSPELQKFMMETVLKNIHKFITHRQFNMTTINCPYLVNDLCLYSTDKIRRAEKDMGFDPYDEIPMNAWAINNKLEHVYIRGAYAIHTFFAFVSGGQIRETEQQIHDIVLEKSKEIHHFDLP